MESDGDGKHPRQDVHEGSTYPVGADVYDTHAGALSDPVDPFEPHPGGTVVEAGSAEVPPWGEQITCRALVVAVILGTVFCIITHRLNLTGGIIPSLNVPAGLLGFFLVNTWVTVAPECGISSKPFTRQENTVIQTCVVACYGVARSGGFGSYLVDMSQVVYDKMGSEHETTVKDLKNPSLGRMYAFTFTVGLLGIFVLVPLRKIMIIDYKLTYPSGTATAELINSFHTPGVELAKEQVRYLRRYFTFSFAWSLFKWLFSGIGNSCGFDYISSLGLKAYTNCFNMTYVGAGILSPRRVNCSVMFGAVISWGLMWPLIRNKEGDWFPAGLDENRDVKGLFGYKLFIPLAIFLGDGVYAALRGIYILFENRQLLPTTVDSSKKVEEDTSTKCRKEYFLKDRIPHWIAVTGYCTLVIVSIIVISIMFSIKWYYLFVSYIIAPLFAYCNAHVCGLTDWNLANYYGQLLLFCFAAWAGSGGCGIIVGLTVCGVTMSIVSRGSDLMQDFKTGYLTLSSPRSMFTAQLIGGVMGCVIAPVTFWFLWNAFNMGTEYGAYTTIYGTVALIGVEGFGSLPNHCLQLCAGWFAFTVLLNAVRDYVPEEYSKFLPIPTAMAIPFLSGAYFAIDIFIGTCIRLVWQGRDRLKADTFAGAMASGLISGDGLWTLPSVIFSFARVDAPICM